MTSIEQIKDKIGQDKYEFFKKLQSYLDTKLYFYGSVNRFDYFNGSSDLDIAVITDDVNGLIFKLQTYLHLKKSEVKQIYQSFHVKPPKLIKGYKVKYENNHKNLSFDILVYDEKYRKIVINNLNESNSIPFYIVFLLLIIKSFYYNMGIIGKETYLHLKHWMFHMYLTRSFSLYNKMLTTTIILDN